MPKYVNCFAIGMFVEVSKILADLFKGKKADFDRLILNPDTCLHFSQIVFWKN